MTGGQKRLGEPALRDPAAGRRSGLRLWNFWIPITIAASLFCRTFARRRRSTLKSGDGDNRRHLRAFRFGNCRSSTPLSCWRSTILSGRLPYPSPGAIFALWVVVGALTPDRRDISAHSSSLRFRNFAGATAYSRTEPAQAAVFGLGLPG